MARTERLSASEWEQIEVEPRGRFHVWAIGGFAEVRKSAHQPVIMFAGPNAVKDAVQWASDRNHEFALCERARHTNRSILVESALA